jgi:DNA replication ATP-dependent helicase Dna2
VTSLVTLLRGRALDQLENECDVNGAVRGVVGAARCTDEDFWRRRIGIVTPHRAQQSLVIRRLQSTLGGDATKNALIRDAVDTVERFQGQERDTIIVSFALGDPDAIAEEEEFLLSFCRFNVMASRARAKVIVFISQEVVDYLARDSDVLKDSALLKTYAQSFCDQGRPMTLQYPKADRSFPPSPSTVSAEPSRQRFKATAQHECEASRYGWTGQAAIATGDRRVEPRSFLSLV